MLDNEKPDGVLVQFGGQTPLKLARALEAAGYPIWGTSPESHRPGGGPRPLRKAARTSSASPRRAHGEARDEEEAVEAARRIGYPAGRAAVLRAGRPGDGDRLRRDAAWRRYMTDARSRLARAPRADRPVPRRRRRARRGRALRRQDAPGSAASMQHIEEAGIHSGDSFSVLPPWKVPTAAPGRDPGGDPRLAEGALRQGPREHPVRDPARRALRAGGQPAGVADRAVRLQGDRRADGAGGRAPRGRAVAASRSGLPAERDPVDFFIKAPVFPVPQVPRRGRRCWARR